MSKPILNKLVATLMLTGIAVASFSQTEGVADPYFFDRFWGNLILALALVAIIGVFGVVINMANLVIKLKERALLKEQGIEWQPEVEEEKESLFQKWYKNLTDAVPIEREADVMLDHNYDGIQELDNSLPPWWVAMFYITIVAGVVYFAYYHIFGYGMSSTEEYALEMEYANEQKAAHLAKLANLVNENNVKVLTDEQSLATGKQIYTLNCVACHGVNGEGGVGPNFADNYWIHGNQIGDLYKVIKYGVPEKGMIAWSNQLTPGDMNKVASYILTFVGTNPPNQKEPQGEKFEPGTPASKDTTSTPPTIGMK